MIAKPKSPFDSKDKRIQSYDKQIIITTKPPATSGEINRKQRYKILRGKWTYYAKCDT